MAVKKTTTSKKSAVESSSRSSMKAALKQEQAAQARVRDYRTLVKPVVTEKAAGAGGASTAATVVFRVDPDATKTEIKDAIERVFQVKVAKVRTINILGKVKRSGRSMGRRMSTKKAYVTLREGFTIDLVEGV